MCTQTLTTDFCINYILDLDNESGSEVSRAYLTNLHITETDFDEDYI